MLEVIAKSSGIVYPIAQAFGVTRSTVYEWLKSDEDLKTALDYAREDIVDVIESKYLKRAIGGSERAQEFLLKTLGKNRGYVERKDLTSKGESVFFDFPNLTAEEIESLKHTSDVK